MTKQITNHNTTIQINKPYNLEERTMVFAKGIISLCFKLAKHTVNFKLTEQLVAAAGSVGANYREANEAVSKKDFSHRMRITRKECKEASYWLELLKEANDEHAEEIGRFLEESKELRNIFSAIIEKTTV